MRELKYKKEIEEYKPDLSGYKEPENRLAFRWVFENINDPRNFLPPAKREYDIVKPDVTDWALSFFVTKEKAKTRIKKFAKKNPRVYMKLGTHTAEGLLGKDDGISEHSHTTGHFNHFEYKDVDLVHRFKIVDYLVN